MFSFIFFVCIFAVSLGAENGCPKNSLSLEKNNGSICYSFHSNFLKFALAESHCKSFDAQLVSLKNEYISTLLAGYADKIFDDSVFFWTSGNRLQNSSFWQWSDEEEIEYEHFGLNEEKKNGSCISVEVKEGRWKAENCFAEFSFICEFESGNGIIPLAAENVDSIAPALKCPEEWEMFGENCYKIYPKLSWHDAEQVCQNESAHLASIHSQEENDFISELGNNSTEKESCDWFDQIWIGFNNATSEIYSWSDGTSKIYENWQSKKPDNQYKNETCVEITVSKECKKKPYGKWNDFNCEKKVKFICKKSAKSNFDEEEVSSSAEALASTTSLRTTTSPPTTKSKKKPTTTETPRCEWYLRRNSVGSFCPQSFDRDSMVCEYEYLRCKCCCKVKGCVIPPGYAQ